MNMLFIEQLQKQFLSTLKADFQGGEPRGDDYFPDTPTNLKNSAGERVKDGLGQNINPQEFSEEQQKVLEEIQGLQNELEGLEATKKFNATAGEYLSKKLTPEDFKDPEAQETIRQLNLYKQRYLEAVKATGEAKEKLQELRQSITKLGNKFEHTAGFDMDQEGTVTESKLTAEKMNTISNSEFLSLPKEERLQYVTKDNDDYSDVKSGRVSQVEFNFDSDADGVDNADLYRLTTAGQVFGKEVGTLRVDGQTYTRSGLDGEFFDGNKRLTIHTGTQVEVVLRDEAEIKALRDNFNEAYVKYEKSDNFDEKNRDIVHEALERGIEPDMVLDVFSKILEKETDVSDRAVKLEELFTQVERIRGDLGLEANGDILKKYLIDNNNDGKLDEFTSVAQIIDFVKISGGDLSKVDFRPLSSKYPREASLKNNNPAGLTWNSTFASTLSKHGIQYTQGTARPSSEGGHYFSFPNMEEGMNAFNLLWEIKLVKMKDKTFGDFAKNWAVDYHSYKNRFSDIWNIKISDLSEDKINVIKSQQMRIESPGMHKELSKFGIV